MVLGDPVVFLTEGSISQEDDRNSFGEDFEAGTEIGFKDVKTPQRS